MGTTGEALRQRFLLQGTLSAVHVLPLVQARNCYARSELLSSRSAIGSGVKLCSAVVASVATSVRATEINANKCKYLHLQTRYRETGELRLRFVSSNCREASGSSKGGGEVGLWVAQLSV